MKKLCSNCFQEIKEGDKNCSLCNTPYVPTIDEDDSQPIKERKLPSAKLQIPKGVLAIIISVVIAIVASTFGTFMYLRNIETPERAALEGVYILLNADTRGFAARHAFMEADIGLAIRSGRAVAWDIAAEPFIWEIYNELERVINALEKDDIRISVANYEEITDKDTELNIIYHSIVGDPDINPERAKIVDTILSNVDSLFVIDIEIADVSDKTLNNMMIVVHIGLIDGKWLILSEKLL